MGSTRTDLLYAIEGRRPAPWLGWPGLGRANVFGIMAIQVGLTLLSV